VLEGSIRRAGNRLRITAQLVETTTRHSAWAERYDREMEDVFAIQDEIARSIAQALRVTLSPQEEKTIARKPTETCRRTIITCAGAPTHDVRTRFRPGNVRAGHQARPELRLAHTGVATICGMIYEMREQQRANGSSADSWPATGRWRSTRNRRRLALRPGCSYAGLDHGGLRALAIERKPDCEGVYNILGRALFHRIATKKRRPSSSARWKRTATTTTPTFPT
jgi:hypothetical protein